MHWRYKVKLYMHRLDCIYHQLILTKDTTKWNHSPRNIATRTDVKSEVIDMRDRFNYVLKGFCTNYWSFRSLGEMKVKGPHTGRARVCGRYRSGPRGIRGFYGGYYSTVFHSAYLWLSLINDTVVLTPLKYREGRGISAARLRLITDCMRIVLHACTNA